MQIILLTTLFFFISTSNATENCLLNNLASLARLNHKLDDYQGIKVNLTFNGETIHDGVFERKLDAGGVNYIIINDNGARRIVPVSSIDKIETTFFPRETNPRDIQEQLRTAVRMTNDKNVGTSGDFITIAVIERRDKDGKIERITTQIEVVNRDSFVIFDGSNRQTISPSDPGFKLISVAPTKIDDFAIKRGVKGGLTTLEVNTAPRVNRDFRRPIEKLKAELRVSNYERIPSHEKFFNQGDNFFKDLSEEDNLLIDFFRRDIEAACGGLTGDRKESCIDSFKGPFISSFKKCKGDQLASLCIQQSIITSKVETGEDLGEAVLDTDALRMRKATLEAHLDHKEILFIQSSKDKRAAVQKILTDKNKFTKESSDTLAQFYDEEIPLYFTDVDNPGTKDSFSVVVIKDGSDLDMIGNQVVYPGFGPNLVVVNNPLDIVKDIESIGTKFNAKDLSKKFGFEDFSEDGVVKVKTPNREYINHVQDKIKEKDPKLFQEEHIIKFARPEEYPGVKSQDDFGASDVNKGFLKDTLWPFADKGVHGLHDKTIHSLANIVSPKMVKFQKERLKVGVDFADELAGELANSKGGDDLVELMHFFIGIEVDGFAGIPNLIFKDIAKGDKQNNLLDFFLKPDSQFATYFKNPVTSLEDHLKYIKGLSESANDEIIKSLESAGRLSAAEMLRNVQKATQGDNLDKAFKALERFKKLKVKESEDLVLTQEDVKEWSSTLYDRTHRFFRALNETDL